MTAGSIDLPGVTNDDGEADRRYGLYRERDPLPELEFGLLNYEQIERYVAQTGMVCPFRTDNGQLKVASYEIPFLGTVYEKSEDLLPKQTKIEEGTPFVLKKNSIAFLNLQTTFRLPLYIAARFNLQIKHVHRGLLLGTGPLVDPGFKGNLLIPLHNLTAGDYLFVGGEGFIWAEFTKLVLAPPKANAPKDKPPRDYFAKATGGPVPGSSIPEAIVSAKNDAEKAQKWVRLLTGFGILGVISLIVSLVSLVVNVRSMAFQLTDNVRDGQRKLDESSASLLRLESRLKAVETRIAPHDAGAPPPQRK